MKIPKILQTISKTLLSADAKAIVVGGSVRDWFLKLPIKDYDIEVYGLKTIEELEDVLSKYGSVNLVGKSFGVLKFVYEKEEYDFSFPRSEKKTGAGHRGFEVYCSGDMSFKEASFRRDFTINAMGFDIESSKFIDPFDGSHDMDKKVLRHIDDKTFVEDPLRVYRAVQFCARFGYELDEKTKLLCVSMVSEGMLEELPKERVYKEFEKLLLKSDKPSVGFELMRELGVLKYFPELYDMIGVKQDPKWHLEGDVWVHTMMSLDVMASLRCGESKLDLKLMYGVLCHDMGKVVTTKVIDGKIRSFGHERAGVLLCESFMYRLCDEHGFIGDISTLVKYHMAPSAFFSDGAKDRAIRRLSTKVNIKELIMVAKADFLGRVTKEANRGFYEAGEWLREKSESLNVDVSPPINLLQGRDLISLGLKPSREFSTLLKSVYDKQLDGLIMTKEEALLYIKENYIV